MLLTLSGEVGMLNKDYLLYWVAQVLEEVSDRGGLHSIKVPV